MYISQSHVYCILVTNIPLSYSTTLHQAEQERKAAVIRAEGEAEAAKLISQAMSTAGTGFVEVRGIDTANELAAILGKGQNVVYLPSSKSGSNMLLNIGGEKK